MVRNTLTHSLIVLFRMTHFPSNFSLQFLSHLSTKFTHSAPKIFNFPSFTNPTKQILQKITVMVESDRPQRKESKPTAKGSSAASTATRSATARPSNTPSPSPPITLPNYLSTVAQEQRYFRSYKTRDIIEPKYLDLRFLEDENFDCYTTFKSLGLVKFMSLKEKGYPDLVRMFHSNLEIRNNCIIS